MGNHIYEEFQRLIRGGAGIIKASLEADFMTDQLTSNAIDMKEVQKCIDSLPIFTIEDKSGRKSISRAQLRAFDFIWTVDGPLIEHIDGLTESLHTKYTSVDIIKYLSGKDTPSIPLPRLIGKRSNALKQFEISSISIDNKNIFVNLCWKNQENRWRIFTYKELENIRKKCHEHLDIYRMFRFNTAIALAVGNVECNKPNISWINVRGVHIFLEQSPITLIWKAFNGEPYSWVWISELIQTKKINERNIPRLREELISAGADPDDIIPKMVIEEEQIFDPKSFARY